MRYYALAVAISGAASVFGQAVKTPVYQGSSSDESYTTAYSRRKEVTVVGRVTGKIKGTPADKGVEGMSILVRDAKGKVHQVDMGPTWFIKDQEAKINMGDKVKVTGAEIFFASTKAHVILARQIIRQHKILSLRDSSGFPYWNANRPGRVAVQGGTNEIEGQIVSQNTVQAENLKQVAYQIQTANGLVNVAVAPNWFMEQSGLGFKVGDNVTVYTGAGPSQFGNNIILADGLYGSGGTYVLRPGGIPVWSGWTPFGGPGF